MPQTEGSASMFETVKKHGEVIDTHKEFIDTHGQIIEAHGKSIDELKTNFKKLEENDQKQTEKLDSLSSQLSNVVLQNTELKSTILQSSQAQQEFFRETMSKQWELIKARDDIKEAERKRVHEINLSEQDLKKSNAEKRWEFIGKVFVSGSAVYLILEYILKTVGGN